MRAYACQRCGRLQLAACPNCKGEVHDRIEAADELCGPRSPGITHHAFVPGRP
jgi:hypothetical protein